MRKKQNCVKVLNKEKGEKGRQEKKETELFIQRVLVLQDICSQNFSKIFVNCFSHFKVG